MSVNFQVGQRVELIDKKLQGNVAYVGETLFQPGITWIGIILDEPKGKNNGSVNGHPYFKCDENCGVFVKPNNVKLVENSPEGETQAKKQPSSGLRPPQTQTKKPSPGNVLPSDTGSTEIAKETTAQPPKSKMPTKLPATSGVKAGSSTESLKSSPSMEKLKQAATPSAQKVESPTEDTVADLPPPPVKSSGIPAPSKEHRGSVVAQEVAKLKDLEKRRESQAVVSPSHHIAGVEAGSVAELEYLRGEVKDLSEKLETLRIKRQEDKQKLIDYEKCKIQLQQLIEYKSKISESHADLQRQLAQSRKETKEAIESKEIHAEEMAGLAETAELAALDKEVAEEKAELLQQEVDALKAKVDELTTDLELIKAEFEGGGVPKAGEVVPTGLQIKQLEVQKEKLAEALVKMKDLYTLEKQQTQKLTKDLESAQNRLQELTRKHDKLSQENTQYEHQVNELKEQVDAAMGAEEMVEQLTQKNLALEEQLQKMEETVKDLEQMREIDQELQENARDAERELQNELDKCSIKIAELKMALESEHAHLKDHERTIEKFRKHTMQLQEEIQDLKDQLSIAQEKKAVGSLEGENTFSGGLMFNQTKALSSVIESNLKSIELEFSQQHVRYLKAFLPDNFGKTGGDVDSLALVLLFPRMSSKVQLLISTMREKHPIPPSGITRDHVVKSHKGEQWAFVDRMTCYLQALLTQLKRYDSVLSRCSIERLARMAQLLPELAAQERNLDTFIDLVKANRLDENTPLDALENGLTYFQNLYAVHLTSEIYDHTQFLLDFSRQLLTGLQWIATDLLRIRHFMLASCEGSAVWKFVGELQMFVKECEQLCRSIRGKVPQDSAKGELVKLPDEVVDRLVDCATHVHKAAKILSATCAGAANQVTLLPDMEGVDSKRMQELLQEGVQKVCGKGESKTAEDMLQFCLGVVMAHCTKIAEALEKGEFDAKVTDQKPFPPILERAHARKQEAVEADSLRWQLEKKDNEIMEVKKALRSKAEEMSELQVRKEMAEKRLQTTGKEGDERVVRLERRLDERDQELKKKEREYEQTMDTLQQDIEALERENADLKNRIKMLTKQALLRGIAEQGVGTPQASSVTSLGAPIPSPSSNVTDSPMLILQIEELRSALRCAQQKRYRLLAEKMKIDMESLPPLKVPMRSTGLTVTGKSVDYEHLRLTPEINQLVRDGNRLQKEYVKFVAENRVVDVSKCKPGKLPTSMTNSPAYHVYVQECETKRLQNWANDLRAKLEKYRLNDAAFGVPDTRTAASFVKVGSLTVPTDDKTLAGCVIETHVTVDMLKTLHTQLAF